MKKLHLGCGFHFIDGWINTDISPTLTDDPLIDYLDVTETFPFDSEEIDYIFTEHLIEHIDYVKGLDMLIECYRVLKPNGKIRIATPDLSFLIDLYGDNKTDLQKKYMEEFKTHSATLFDTYKSISTNHFHKLSNGKKPKFPTDTFIINNFVRAWGHEFIYDKKTLTESMEWVGFKDIKICKLCVSDDENLNNLENKDRMSEGMLEMESIVLEGTK